MPDMWVAECLACKWEDHHDSQLGAIEAAQNHVFDLHRDVPAEQRAAQKIGHVQLRTVPLSPPEQKESAGESRPEPLVASHQQPVEDEPAESSLPEHVKFTHRRKHHDESEG